MNKQSKIAKVASFIGALLLLIFILTICIFTAAIVVRMCVAVWLFGWNLFPGL